MGENRCRLRWPDELAVDGLNVVRPAERILVNGMMFSELSSENSYFLSARRRLRNIEIFSHFSLSSENS